MTTTTREPDEARTMSHPARATVTFSSAGVECHGWHFRAAHDELSGPAGRPCVVMAHGLAGTKDSGLQPFAESLARAGLDVLAFDYRGFGESGGDRRQVVSVEMQQEDYRSAMQTAAGLDGVDSKRLVLWGVSMAGGHVLSVAADRDDVAAVVAVTPLVDGLAAAKLALQHHSPTQILRSTGLGMKAKVAGRTGRAAVLLPVVARPGETGALTVEGAYEAYHAIAGPSWRNEIEASFTTELGSFRPTKDAKRVTAPTLVQIADFDRSAPPYAAAKAAVKARAEVRHYPCDHFDVYPGSQWHDAVVAHQVTFLTRHLARRDG